MYPQIESKFGLRELFFIAVFILLCYLVDSAAMDFSENLGLLLRGEWK